MWPSFVINYFRTTNHDSSFSAHHYLIVDSRFFSLFIDQLETHHDSWCSMFAHWYLFVKECWFTMICRFDLSHLASVDWTASSEWWRWINREDWLINLIRRTHFIFLHSMFVWSSFDCSVDHLDVAYRFCMFRIMSTCFHRWQFQLMNTCPQSVTIESIDVQWMGIPNHTTLSRCCSTSMNHSSMLFNRTIDESFVVSQSLNQFDSVQPCRFAYGSSSHNLILSLCLSLLPLRLLE